MTPGLSTRYGAPPGIAGVALLFWAAVTGHWFAGILMAIAVEARRLVRTRWEIGVQLLLRIWILCTVMFLVALIVGLVREGVARSAFFAVEWLPLCGLPIMLAQVYGTREGVSVRVLSVISRLMERRRRRSGHPPTPDTVVNIEYPYVCTALLAAGAPQPDGVLFYVGAAGLVTCGLFLNRERPRLNVAVWVTVALITTVLGFVGHVWLHRLHVHLENMAVGLNVSGSTSTMKRSVIRLGAVGEIKLSRRIDWWVKPVSGETPGYLRRAVYDTYRREMWLVARGREMMPAGRHGEGDAVEWSVPPATDTLPDSQIGIIGRREGDETQLALPARPLTLQGLSAETVGRTRLGLTVARDTSRVLDFQVHYRAGDNADLPPGDEDLFVPDQLHACMDRVLAEAGAVGLSSPETVKAITRFFDGKFVYSTYLKISSGAGDPVQTFLERNRSGHCEYFASATVLLLRRAGIPARYVTGHVVREYDRRRGLFVLRGLHAHAWVQAWSEGGWRYVDTTPGSWLETERSALTWWQPMADWLEGLPLAWALWIRGRVGRGFLVFVRWATLPLLAAYLWLRLFRGQHGRRVRAGLAEDQARYPGMDSEWYELEPHLAEMAGARLASEPLGAWWRRTGFRCPEPVKSSVGAALDLHYRLRFDTGATCAADRVRLRKLVEEVRNACGPKASE